MLKTLGKFSFNFIAILLFISVAYIYISPLMCFIAFFGDHSVDIEMNDAQELIGLNFPPSVKWIGGKMIIFQETSLYAAFTIPNDDLNLLFPGKKYERQIEKIPLVVNPDSPNIPWYRPDSTEKYKWFMEEFLESGATLYVVIDEKPHPESGRVTVYLYWIIF